MVSNIYPTERILREKKRTLYKMHPDQENFFGHVITMPNLPFGLRERDVFLRVKGYKENPQELRPEAELVKNDGGELFLVPKGYELKRCDEKTLFVKNKIESFIDTYVWRVVQKEDTNGGVPCPECGKMCASDLGLHSHMRSHTKSQN